MSTASGIALIALSGGLYASSGAGIISHTLDVPTPFAAADVIVRDPDGDDRVAFHYAIVEVAARVDDPEATPVAAHDVDGVRWVPVNQLRNYPGRARMISACPPCSVVLLHKISRRVTSVVEQLMLLPPHKCLAHQALRISAGLRSDCI